MGVKPVIIDSNIWSDLRGFLDRVKDDTGRSYEETWEAFSDGFQSKLLEEKYKTFRTAITTIKTICEMKNSKTDTYEIHIPNEVYNEVGRSVSSKMCKDEATGNDLHLAEFRDVVSSVPIKTIIESTKESEPEIDIPTKKGSETDMKKFLNNKRNEFTDLLEHLRNADDTIKTKVQSTIEKLQKRYADLKHKSENWDRSMNEAAKSLDFSYTPRNKDLMTMYDSITNKYNKVSTISFKPDPLEPVTSRLTVKNEEFDYFDLKIYLYAKKIKAPIITKNTQAFQEINDAHFLGYFDDVKIMHPLINFDSLEDLSKKEDLLTIIDNAIDKDFQEDLAICNNLDERLDEKVLGSGSKGLIDDAKQSVNFYKDDPSSIKKKRLKIKTQLGDVLKLLRIKNRQLKVNKESIMKDYKQIDILKVIDEKYFNNQLKSENFVTDNPIVELKDKTIKSQVLIQHIEKENAGLKKSIQEYIQKPGTFFDNFLAIYKNPAERVNAMKLLLASQLETEYSKNNLDTAVQEKESAEGSCIKGGARKREARKCLVEWEDIEKFNEEKIEKRDPSKVKIDSEKFIELLKTVKDPNTRNQLIDFADQVINSAEDHLSKISGPKVSQVTHLINRQKVLNHFTKVHTFSSALNYGLFAKSLLGDILTGNVEGIALNLGFMGGSYVFSKLAAASYAKGASLAEDGKLFFGRSMKYASPFIGRFMSALIYIDLYNQIKALADGDKDALVGVIGDGIFVIIDAVDIGVSLLEIAGLIEGVSAFTGPIGLVIGAVVIIGTDIFMAVRKVQKLDQVIHLTTGERWEIGAATFFTFGLVKFDVERLAQIKDANNKLAQQALEALKSNQNIQRIVIPSAALRGEDNIELEQDNKFVPSNLASGIRWQRVRPDNPEGGWIFCAPQGDWENPPSSVMGRCENSIGVADLALKKENYTLFNLGDGNDEVQGFKDSQNIFRIGKGLKKMRGGDRNDVFILEEGITLNDFPEGEVIGGGGSNLLDLRGISKEGTDGLVINFQEEPKVARLLQVINSTSHLVYKPKMNFFDIESVIGREDETDYIYTNCSTKYVDSRGGRFGQPDQILINHTYKECNHDKVIQLAPNTLLINEAVTGKFSYFVNDIHSDIRCSLRRSPPYKTQVIKNNQIQHKFFINGTMSDILKLEYHHDKNEYYDVNIRMYFKDNSGKINMFHLDTALGYAKDNGGMDNLAIHMKDDVELRYHHNGIYALHKSNKPVLDIIKKYQPIAVNFGISFFIYAVKDGGIVSIGSDQKDDVLHNDPSMKTHLVGNKGNNTYIIISGQDFLPGPDPPQIPEIDIYSTESQNHINTLDLHDLSKQIKEDLGQELLMKHVFDAEKLVLYLYTFNNQNDAPDSYNNVTSITFRNIPTSTKWDSWCNRLHVLLNRAPVVLKCDHDYQNKSGLAIDLEKDVIDYNPANYYTPLPLVFSDYEIIVINENDIEPHTEIIVKQKLGKYRFLRLENDLVLSNGFDYKVPAYRPTTVLIKNFYKDPEVFYSLKFTFNDKVLSFIPEMDNITNAFDVEYGYEEYEYIFNSIIDNLPRRSRRDLGINEDTASRKKIDEFKESQLPATGLFGSVFQSLSNICYKSLGYVHDYYKSLASSTPMLVGNQFQNPKDNFPNEHRIANERISSSKTNIPLPNENQIAQRDVNSTLLLLDVLVRRLNDSKYKLPSEDDLLPPQEQVQKKIVELTKKLGLDDNDIAGSMKKQQQRILNRLSEK